jgi:tRNA G18 (ribose-2'-O)-methylase SpoU
LHKKLTTEQIRSTKPERKWYHTLPKRQVVLILDHINNTANIGNIFRLADAFRIEKLWLYGSSFINGRKYKRYSKRIDKWVPWEQTEDKTVICNTVKHYENQGYCITAIELCDDAEPLFGCGISQPVVIIIGSELDGVSQELLEICNRVLYLPMQGMGNSINVSNCTAIALYEIINKKLLKIVEINGKT